MGGRPVELARVPGMTVERARQFISWAEVTRNYDSDAYVTGKDAERAVALANQEYGYGRVVIVMWPKVAAMAREQDEAARVPIARIMVVLQVTRAEPGYRDDDDDVKDGRIRDATGASDRKESVREAKAATAARRMTVAGATTMAGELGNDGDEILSGSGNAADDNGEGRVGEGYARPVQHHPTAATRVDAAASTTANNETESLVREEWRPPQVTMARSITPATSAPRFTSIWTAAPPALRDAVPGAAQAARPPDPKQSPAKRLQQPPPDARPAPIPRHAAAIAYGPGAGGYDPHRAVFVNRYYVARHAQLKFEAEWARQALTAYDAMRASRQAGNPAVRGRGEGQGSGRQAGGR
ncbi:hypothetical protein Tdes44962_MAKER09446 [Teratosphaeria destructans]|uniref:Uncharacterized protein n=1 Tax=Teratosphaeria destructans TaxID=418781 RepID=A0A9W7SSZ5_9PEZI|nr:hypothetical protein Tdes44962_MAKER09446 [Teratosphaeria destructans]